jgi:peptidase E
MKLLLTSGGFSTRKITKEFFKLLGKNPEDTNALLITIKTTKTKQKKSFSSVRKMFKKLNISNVTITNLDKRMTWKQVNNYDLMYIHGGNTFFILDKLRRNGFVRIAKKFILSGKLYVGLSAGSILPAPSIEVAG